VTRPFTNRWASLAAGAIALAAAGLLTAGAPPRPSGLGARPETVRRALQGHALRTLDGKSFTIGSLRGEVVVVNFWASWCPPCRKELPALEALHARLGGQGRVVAISIDQEPRNVERFAKSNHLTLPIVHDGPDGLAKQLDLPSVPFTLVIGKDGEIAMTTSGTTELARVESTARQLASQPLAAEPRPATQTTMEGTNP
jgi:thiol-disulfide isomerase/thioredoxin